MLKDERWVGLPVPLNWRFNHQARGTMKNYNNSLHLIYQALAKLLFVYNIDFEQFNKSLRAYYVREVYQDRQNISRTSLKSGIDRRRVSAIINSDEAPHRTSIFNKILAEFLRLAQSQPLIKKYGKKSINSIMQKNASGSTTVNTIVTELQSHGFIKDLGKSVQYIKTRQQDNTDEILKELSQHINMYINAVISREQKHSIDRD
jgi:SOS response regulatory protein OraA/RecX